MGKLSGQRFVVIGGILLTLGVQGCATPGQKTAIGAGAGAGAGAIIGGLAGRDAKTAAIGGLIGAAAGGAVGNYLDKQANELAQVAETKRTEQGILVNLKNELLFETGKAELKPEASTQLNQLGAILAKYPEDRIRISGYTDNTGSERFNELLSKERAGAVRDILTSHGVQEKQLMIHGYGKNNPVASNTTAQGRSSNRRVELVIDVPQKNG